MAGFSIDMERLIELLRDRGHTALVLVLNGDGGAGSGHWGHSGRPGIRGGSKAGSGGISNRIALKGGGFTSKSQQAKAERQAERATAAARELESRVLGSAPEEPVRARETNPIRQSQWKRKLATEREALEAKKPNQQALEMWKKGILDKQTALSQAKDGSITDTVRHYYETMEANGDPTPTKPTVDEQRSVGPTLSEYGGDWSKARVGAIQKDTGMSQAEAEQTKKVMDQWTGGMGEKADTATLDKYVERAPAFSGKIYRGLKFNTPAEYDAFMEKVKSGVIRMNGNSSWTSDREVARRFSSGSQDDVDSVEIHCGANRTSVPIEHLTQYGGEDEVLAHSRASWSVLSVQEHTTPAGGRKTVINVVERGEYEDA